jgi:hypothetical protein
VLLEDEADATPERRALPLRRAGEFLAKDGGAAVCRARSAPISVSSVVLPLPEGPVSSTTSPARR